MNTLVAQASVRRWRLVLLPLQAIIPVTFVVLLLSGGVEHASHVLATVVYLCLGSSTLLLVGGAAAVLQTHDRRLMWSALGFALGGFVLASLLWGAAFPPPTKHL